MINSHNNWSPLKEVWLGDVYPTSWYDHLESEVRDCFHEITDKTKEDLTIIQNKLLELGVNVCRPTYEKIDDYVGADDSLVKPEICPRDYYVTIGNELYASWGDKVSPWQEHLTKYTDHNSSSVQKILTSRQLFLNGANTVRVGKDLYFDVIDIDKREQTIKLFQEKFAPLFEQYRIHLLANGGHCDGCFTVLKPGLILASTYFTDYANTFPDWELINLSRPEFKSHRPPSGHNGKWWLSGMENKKSFNSYVIDHAKNWIGEYTETFFELNCLVVDEKNVLMLGENEKLFTLLQKHGITVHSVPFRTRTFWDGGLHCLTVDIRRESSMEDYFPTRGNQQLFLYEKDVICGS